MIRDFRGEYNFLSNFYPVKVKCDFGLIYNSTEAAYQAQKTMDRMIRLMFTNYKPIVAKRNGKKIKLRNDWEEVKLDIMLDLLRQKFQYSGLRQKLIDTGDEKLIEGNWWGDTFWGICRGIGENHLGKLLMKVRAELLEQKENNI